MCHNFFIHSSVSRHLGYFHVLAIVNSAAMNNRIHVSFSILVSSGYMPRHGIADHSKGYHPWVFIGRSDAKAETPILCPPHLKSWLIGKDSDSGRNWGQEEKGRTEDEMAGWHHRPDGHEFEWYPRVGGGQRGLSCYNSRGHNELDTTEWLKWTEVRMINTSSHKLCSIY